MATYIDFCTQQLQAFSMIRNTAHICYCVCISGHRWIFGSEVNVTVGSGENITLYCDCKILTDEIIMWYRNCTHENQPPLVLEKEKDPFKPASGRATLVNLLLRFHFVENQSSSSYDLLIMNISDSDEGLYYCGTERSQSVGGNKHKFIYGYSNATTRIRFSKYSSILPFFLNNAFAYDK